MKKVAVVILNWNGKHWLEKFLPSVKQFNDDELSDIILVDNASTDNSLNFLADNYPTLQTIFFKENYGFTGGYNKALLNLDGYEYFVLLNSDIEVTENWLNPIIDLMDNNKNITACQPKILSYNNKEYFEYAGAAGGFIDYLGYPFCRGRIFDTLEKDEGQYNDAKPVFWATGACMFVRADAYKKMNGLDEHFFAHMEEIDLCWRMQNAGYEVWVQPQSTVYHVGGGTLNTDSPRKTYLNFRNNLLMMLKNIDLFKVYPIIFLRMILDGLAGIKFLTQGKFAHCFAIVKAHFAFYKMQFKYLKNRNRQKPLNTIVKQSIVFNYFLDGKKKFSELKERY